MVKLGSIYEHGRTTRIMPDESIVRGKVETHSPPPDGIAATIHVYPAATTTADTRANLCRQDFARREQELRRSHPARIW